MYVSPHSRLRVQAAALPFVLLSVLYFLDTTLRASLKTFWYDELLTVYLCRMPSFQATWGAVIHGCDFNPPLLYLLTRGGERLFGEGLIASRLPAILGFWVFSVCLYAFSSRRVGNLCGTVAAMFPVFTLAHYYAYEARPYGLMLGFSGLMMICWQNTRVRSKAANEKSLWLLGLSLSFLAALLTHAYSIFLLIPFLSVEALSLLKSRRPRVGTCAALLIPLPLVAPLYLQLFHNLRSLGIRPVLLHPQVQFKSYLFSVFGPALVVILFAIFAIAWQAASHRQDPSPENAPRFTKEELVLAFSLILLPLVGIFTVKAIHGQYFDRYFLVATAGFAFPLAQLVAGSCRSSKLAIACIGCMATLLIGDSLLAVRAIRVGADIVQVEPASQHAFVSNPARPLDRDYALTLDTSGLEILVTGDHQYFYLTHYAPAKIRGRIIFGATSAQEFPLATYRLLNKWGGGHFQTATYDEFFATHNDFLVYAPNNGHFNGPCDDCLEQFLAAGYTLRSVRRDSDNLLEHFSK